MPALLLFKTSLSCSSSFILYLSVRLEETLSEDDGVYSDMDPPNWQQLVKMEVLAELTPQEIKRQEVINGRAGNIAVREPTVTLI